MKFLFIGFNSRCGQFISLTSHPGQLILAILPWVGVMRKYWPMMQICLCGRTYCERYHVATTASDPPICSDGHSSAGCQAGTVSARLWQQRTSRQPSLSSARLQSVLNAGARLIFQLRRSDHITDAVVSLHWLRVPERIQYKIAY